jgi:monofunctional biosynthetic peptidoglycan transglycosylase
VAVKPNRVQQRRGRLRKWLRGALFLGLALATCSLLLVLGLRFLPPPTSAFMLARQLEALRHGESHFVLKHRWRPLAQLPDTLVLAVIASEDQRFPTHHGFDFEQLQKVLKHSGDKPLRGASTISQQLAKNLFLWSGRSFVRKGLEAWFTTLIEVSWPKRRIVEVYLNVVEFGDGIYGAEAAAQTFFQRPAKRLSSAQAARLAAVLPSPRRFNAARPSAYVQRRQRWIEQQMQQLGGTSYIAPMLGSH